uniref:Uncharacterized protein n=1 Tax=Helianthus annuus TaxID=4232 RepID=A0A251UCQ0_HELAN
MQMMMLMMRKTVVVFRYWFDFRTSVRFSPTTSSVQFGQHRVISGQSWSKVRPLGLVNGSGQASWSDSASDSVDSVKLSQVGQLSVKWFDVSTRDLNAR